MKIRVGTRDSKLAVTQTNIVIKELKKLDPNVEYEIITMKTTGDKILEKPLNKIGGKGLFVKELDEALLENKVDLTIHSYKDMPMDICQELEIKSVSKRENPRDVLILPSGINELDITKPIGCSSLRRKHQLKQLYKDINVEPIRGNVLTRLEKLDKGGFSGIVLAYAGVKRLGLENKIHKIFEIEEILPAACQGIIAIEARKEFKFDLLYQYNNKDAFCCSIAERSFVKTLDGNCSSPIGAYAYITNNKIYLTGFYVDSYGKSIKMNICGDKNDSKNLGEELAHIIK